MKVVIMSSLNRINSRNLSHNKVLLTENQKEILEKLQRSTTSPQRIIDRSKIILTLDGGTRTMQVVSKLNIDKKTVQKWRSRWIEQSSKLLNFESEEAKHSKYIEAIIETLSDAYRPGAPPTFEPEQVVLIVAMACEVLDDSDGPISQRTHIDIAKAAVKRNVVETISRSSVGRFLKRCSSKAA